MATPTIPPAGGSGEEAARATLKGVKDFFSKTFSINLDSVVQLGAPKFRRDAERRAKNAKKKYPVDHLLRNDAMEVVYNVLTANLKTAAQSLPNTPPAMAVLKTAIKEVAEYVDGFVQEFCNEENGGTQRGASEPVDAETKEAVSELIKTFAEGDAVLAMKSLRDFLEIDPERLPLVERANAAIALAWWEQKERIRNGPKKEPEEPGVPLKERFDTAVKAVNDGLGKFNAEIAPGVGRIKVDAERIRREQAAKATAPDKETWIAKALDAPWKWARKLLWG